jgi:hypothetical protein
LFCDEHTVWNKVVVPTYWTGLNWKVKQNIELNYQFGEMHVLSTPRTYISDRNETP